MHAQNELQTFGSCWMLNTKTITESVGQFIDVNIKRYAAEQAGVDGLGF